MEDVASWENLAWKFTPRSLQFNLFLQAWLSQNRLLRAFFHLGLENLQEDCTALGNLMHCLTILDCGKTFSPSWPYFNTHLVLPSLKRTDWLFLPDWFLTAIGSPSLLRPNTMRYPHYHEVAHSFPGWNTFPLRLSSCNMSSRSLPWWLFTELTSDSILGQSQSTDRKAKTKAEAYTEYRIFLDWNWRQVVKRKNRYICVHFFGNCSGDLVLRREYGRWILKHLLHIFNWLTAEVYSATCRKCWL